MSQAGSVKSWTSVPVVGVDALEERDQGVGGVAAQPVGKVVDRVVLAEDVRRSRSELAKTLRR